MSTILRNAMSMAGLLIATQAMAQITLYANEDFQGRSFTAQAPVGDFRRSGFDDRASSAVVTGKNTDRWEVCDEPHFGGRCVVLRNGNYPSLGAMGLDRRVSSVRGVARNARLPDERHAPAPPLVQSSEITFYEGQAFQGRSFTARGPVGDFRRGGFNDRASSAVASGNRWDRWEVCQDVRFGGRCVVLRPGSYPSLAAMGLNDRVSSVRGVDLGARIDDDRYAPLPLVQTSEIVFYEHEGFDGRSFTALASVGNFRGTGFNDLASSAVVRGERREVCEGVGYSGHCRVLRPGQYPSLTAMGLNDRVTSQRAVGRNEPVDDHRYAPAPALARDFGRRHDERLYEAEVTAVRAVVETVGERCWMEREQVAPERDSPRVAGAVIGAVIGGILGHQVGGGSGKDVATGIGALAGAAIGSRAGRGDVNEPATPQELRRCENVGVQARPAYWDVTYLFRGREYRVQMTAQPGATVTVNERGEPRAT